jgi:hypothetical protein
VYENGLQNLQQASKNMITFKDPNAKTLFDYWSHLGPKRRDLLDKSWAGLFREEILPILPVDKLAKGFKFNFGRPSKDLYMSIGVLILQQMHDLTDNETVNQLCFNIQWQYALNITDETDSSTYMCPKTLWSMRNLVTEKGVDIEVFQIITDKLSKIFSIDSKNQRIDSVHIRSNMRRMGRVGVMATTIRKFLLNLKRHHEKLFKSVNTELVNKYLLKSRESLFSRIKPSESAKCLENTGQDMYELYNLFAGNEIIEKMSSFKLLKRVLNEQCELLDGKDDDKPSSGIKVKSARSVEGGSIQNPSDPDAGYTFHKGQGYSVQVMENYSENKSDESLNLITTVEVTPSHVSDTKALIPAIESTQERDLGPEVVLGDALYGSEENCQKAKDLGVELISPAKGYAEKHEIKLSDFDISEKGEILSCPEGKVPKYRYCSGERMILGFSVDDCKSCSKIDKCPSKEGKRYYYYRFETKMIRTSQRRKIEDSAEFRDRYRMRSGIEGAISEIDRKTGIKRLRIRGLPAVRFCVNLKVAGVNIFRASAFKKAKNLLDPSRMLAKNPIITQFKWAVKKYLGNIRKLLLLINDIVGSVNFCFIKPILEK